MKIFRVFRVLKCALWQKMKTWEYRKSAESFLNKKRIELIEPLWN